MAEKFHMEFRVKEMFFDSQRVMQAVDAAKRTNLSKQGAFVRTAARSSIRKRKRISEPGQPPSSHTGLLRDFIFFAYEPFTQSVVIGPAKTNQVFFDDDMRPITGTVPEVLEYGGRITVVEEWNGSRWRRRDLRRMGAVSDVAALRGSRANVFNGGRPIRKRVVTVKARPYMNPALVSAKEDLAKVWKDSVRRVA